MSSIAAAGLQFAAALHGWDAPAGDQTDVETKAYPRAIDYGGVPDST